MLGDFNNTKDSPSTKAIIGTGKSKLVDTRPAERNGDDAAIPITAAAPWTSPGRIIIRHGRYLLTIDDILLSPAMARDGSKKRNLCACVTELGEWLRTMTHRRRL